MDQDWVTVFEALRNIYNEDAYSNIAINEAISRHKGCRDSFVRTFAKETLRETITLDAIIDGLASSGIKKIKKRTLVIIRMGLCAIRSLDSVPDHAAVNEAVSLAKRTARGTEGFINGMLRSYIRDREQIEANGTVKSSRSDKPGEHGRSNKSDKPGEHGKSNKSGGPVFETEICRKAFVYGFKPETVSLIQEQYGTETDRILDGLNTPPDVVLRPNILKTDREALITALNGEGIKAEPAEESVHAVRASGSGILSSELYRKGWFTVQSLPSIMAVDALSPQPGSNVLDMCAAPGGKTAMMAELMGNSGHITACDVHEHRLDLIKATADRLGITMIDTHLADGTVHDPELDEKFDYVLADVPCSGLGVVATKPEIRYTTDPDSYDGLVSIQKAILKNAALYCRPGGYIEYSTCTLNRNENESVVREVTEDLSSLSIVEMRTVLPYNNLVGFYYCLIRKEN